MHHAQMNKPSPWVERHARLIRRGGSVLDLACGAGRHSLYLAGLEQHVTAVDIDTADIAKLAEGRIEIVQADLEQGDWPFPGRKFDAVVVVNYLFRPLFPVLIETLDDDGVLIYDTFAAGNQRFGRPSNPDHLLEPGELLREFAPSLMVVAYEFGVVNEPNPAVRQRLCAINVTAESANK